jgi:hypothetical protein
MYMGVMDSWCLGTSYAWLLREVGTGREEVWDFEVGIVCVPLASWCTAHSTLRCQDRLNSSLPAEHARTHVASWYPQVRTNPAQKVEDGFELRR